MALSDTKCFQHSTREAVARCPECERFYCRECVTEHDGRMICRVCMDGLLSESTVRGGSLRRALGLWGLAALGFALATFVFFEVGRFLLKIPSEFHSGQFLD